MGFTLVCLNPNQNIYRLSFRIYWGDLARHYKNIREMHHFLVAVDSVLHAQGVGLGAGMAVSLRFVSPTSFSTLVCKKCAMQTRCPPSSVTLAAQNSTKTHLGFRFLFFFCPCSTGIDSGSASIWLRDRMGS